MFSDVFKDYVGQLSFYADSTQDAWTSFLIGNIGFLWQSFTGTVTYLVTCQWWSDVVTLPTAFRENYAMLLDGKPVVLSGLLAEPDFYPMLTEDRPESKNLITGLGNALFLALPCTLPQILALRAVILNGWPPAMALTSGAAAGTGLYLALVLFGFDGVIQLTVDWHPVLLVLGLVSFARVTSRAALKPDWSEYDEVKPDWWLHPNRWDFTSRVVLGRQFRSMMALGFFENHAMGHYFGNLTVTPSPSVLETGEVWWLFNTTGYWLGLVVGSVAWSVPILGGWTLIYPRLVGLIRGVPWWRTRILYHRLTVVGMLVLTLHTVPYYGADYLASGPLGLTYQDHLLRIDGAATQMNHMERTYDVDDEEIEPDELFMDNISFHDDTLTYFDHDLAITEVLPLEIPVLLPDSLWDHRFLRDETYEQMAERMKKSLPPGLTSFKRHYNPGDLAFPFTMTPGLEDPNPDELLEGRDPHDNDDGDDDEEKEVRAYDEYGHVITDPTEMEEDYDDVEMTRGDNDEALRGDTVTGSGDFLDRIAKTVFQSEGIAMPIDRYDLEPMETMDAVIRLFRERCLENVIFKSLLRLESVPFLGGQPQSYHVNLSDDVNLTAQRNVLSHYLTSLQDYKRSTKVDDYTIAKRVTNQQFKGTLTQMRYYDAVRVFYPDPYRDDLETTSDRDTELIMIDEEPTVKVLSYDQAHYNRWVDSAEGVLHEELAPTYAERQARPRRTDIRDRAAYRMQNYAAGPMYFGWDASARKLLINASRLPVPDLQRPTPYDGSSVPTTRVPDYFKFQAFPRGVYDDHRQYTLFDLTLPDTDQVYLDKLRLLFGFLQDVEWADEAPDWVKLPEQEESDNGRFEAVGQQQYDVLQRMPQYDWAWRRLFLVSLNDEETDDEFAVRLARRPYFELGHILPPKLDGVAWPGDVDTSLASRFAKKLTKYYFEELMFPGEAFGEIDAELLRLEKDREEVDRIHEEGRRARLGLGRR